jgi:hypothetical protein
LEFHPFIPNPNDGYKGYIPISTVGELALIDRDVGTLRGAYRLTRDLDLLGSPVSVSGNVLTPRPHNWEPLGGSALWFTGTFDGDGRRLTNLYIDRQEDWVGLFSFSSGTIKNTLVSGSVTANMEVGGIAAIVDHGGRVEGCSFDGQVAGNATVGGVAGRLLTGRVEGCSVDGQVTGNQIVGGVAGEVETGGRVEGCSNAGTVTANYGHGGGVAGRNNGAIIACSNKGAVTAANQRAGGVADENNGTITACYNTGTVTSGGETGGVAVYNYGTITACYNVGPVYDASGWGGWMVTANDGGTIQACFWIPGGNVTAVFDSDTGTFASSQQFSSGGWPRGDLDPELLWHIHNADGSGPGYYWKSMGNPSDNPGPTDFPRLWWEP